MIMELNKANYSSTAKRTKIQLLYRVEERRKWHDSGCRESLVVTTN